MSTWADVLDLVTRGLRAGATEIRLDGPGLRLHVSTMDTCVEVPAPVLGVFYGRPAPDAPPFVALGDEVGPDTTVAIVEVMKLMNPVSAGVAGRVVGICVEDGALVEEGQALFRIEPSS
jgi:biotin carboxyl carrier protein